MEFLSNMMVDALRFFSAGPWGYGWGIVFLTLAVNLALYPLTLSSVKSMGAMQKIQPKMKELQEKYKDKPQELQKATLDLYKSEGVNPLGGCLPVLLKIPFFLALFWAFQSTSFLGITSDPVNNTSFLWISGRISTKAFKIDKLDKKLEDLGIIVIDKRATSKKGVRQYVWNAVKMVGDKKLKDILWSADEKKVADIERVQKGLSAMGADISKEESVAIISAWRETNSLAKPDRVDTPFGRISIFALLVGLTTYLMQKSMPGAGAQQTQMMTLFMPLFITFICWNFPVGVQLYWLMSNAVGAVQQYYIMQSPRHRSKKKGGAK